MQLYNYYRSSSSYRVRIVLNIKNQPFIYKSIHLVKEGGQQYRDDFKKINPFSQVPCLEHNGKILSQSLPICLYLETSFPEPPLLPQNSFEKAKVLSFCEYINSTMQPLQNLSVLNKIEKEFKGDKAQWARDWMKEGFDHLEDFLTQQSKTYCFGDSLTLADAFLIPQLYNGLRFEVNLKSYPRLHAINDQCLKLPAFQKALPENQPDSPQNV